MLLLAAEFIHHCHKRKEYYMHLDDVLFEEEYSHQSEEKNSQTKASSINETPEELENNPKEKSMTRKKRASDNSQESASGNRKRIRKTNPLISITSSLLQIVLHIRQLSEKTSSLPLPQDAKYLRILQVWSTIGQKYPQTLSDLLGTQRIVLANDLLRIITVGEIVVQSTELVQWCIELAIALVLTQVSDDINKKSSICINKSENSQFTNNTHIETPNSHRDIQPSSISSFIKQEYWNQLWLALVRFTIVKTAPHTQQKSDLARSISQLFIHLIVFKLPDRQVVIQSLSLFTSKLSLLRATLCDLGVSSPFSSSYSDKLSNRIISPVPLDVVTSSFLSSTEVLERRALSNISFIDMSDMIVIALLELSISQYSGQNIGKDPKKHESGEVESSDPDLIPQTSLLSLLSKNPLSMHAQQEVQIYPNVLTFQHFASTLDILTVSETACCANSSLSSLASQALEVMVRANITSRGILEATDPWGSNTEKVSLPQTQPLFGLSTQKTTTLESINDIHYNTHLRQNHTISVNSNSVFGPIRALQAVSIIRNNPKQCKRQEELNSNYGSLLSSNNGEKEGTLDLPSVVSKKTVLLWCLIQQEVLSWRTRHNQFHESPTMVSSHESEQSSPQVLSMDHISDSLQAAIRCFLGAKSIALSMGFSFPETFMQERSHLDGSNPRNSQLLSAWREGIDCVTSCLEYGVELVDIVSHSTAWKLFFASLRRTNRGKVLSSDDHSNLRIFAALQCTLYACNLFIETIKVCNYISNSIIFY